MREAPQSSPSLRAEEERRGRRRAEEEVLQNRHGHDGAASQSQENRQVQPVKVPCTLARELALPVAVFWVRRENLGTCWPHGLPLRPLATRLLLVATRSDTSETWSRRRRLVRGQQRLGTALGAS